MQSVRSGPLDLSTSAMSSRPLFVPLIPIDASFLFSSGENDVGIERTGGQINIPASAC